MKADMSVSAVTVRLKMLGELWELSVKLMRAKQLSSETPMLGEEPVAERWNKAEEETAWQHLATLPPK